MKNIIKDIEKTLKDNVYLIIFIFTIIFSKIMFTSTCVYK